MLFFIVGWISSQQASDDDLDAEGYRGEDDRIALASKNELERELILHDRKEKLEESRKREIAKQKMMEQEQASIKPAKRESHSKKV